MPTSKILRFFETIVKPTISLASINTGAGRISAVVDNTTVRAETGTIIVQLRAGAAAPTVGLTYKVFLVRRSNDGTNDISDDGLGTSDAGVSTEPTNAELIYTFVLPATANMTHKKVIPVFDLPPKFSIVLWNASGQTWSTTGGDHDLQVLLHSPEAQ